MGFFVLLCLLTIMHKLFLIMLRGRVARGMFLSRIEAKLVNGRFNVSKLGGSLVSTFALDMNRGSLSIHIITWDVGSVASHKSALLALLAEAAPHILLLQEAPLHAGRVRAFQMVVRAVGYSLYDCRGD